MCEMKKWITLSQAEELIEVKICHKKLQHQSAVLEVVLFREPLLALGSDQFIMCPAAERHQSYIQHSSGDRLQQNVFSPFVSLD